MKHKKGTLIPYIILIILLLIFNVPYPVHRELSGVLIQLENTDFCEKVTIELVGSYHLNWLTHDEYSGYFRISDDNLTQKKELTFPIEIGADFEDAESDLEYDLQEEALSKQELKKVQNNLWHNGGRVLSKRFLRKICIVVPSPEKCDDGRMSWDYGDLSNGKGTIIVMGADTYEEAAAIVAKSYGTSVKL